MWYMHVSDNQLTGSIPSEVNRNLPSMCTMILRNNPGLCGRIPPALWIPNLDYTNTNLTYDESTAWPSS
eukprot:4092791-Pyramimonas_sp.AAC.1